MSIVDTTIVDHNTGKQYRYRGSIRIHKNSTDTRDQYEYRKTYSLLKIV